ncbi:MAG TPA: hypothetical protein VIF09_21205 [Polyangiaceae bacterium]
MRARRGSALPCTAGIGSILVLAAAGAVGCKAGGGAGADQHLVAVDAAPVASAAVGAAAVDAQAPPAVSSAAAATSATPAGSTSALAVGDGGAARCRVVRGPVELPVRSPVVLAARGDGVEAVLNDDGRPRTVAFPLGPLPPASAPAATRESADGGTLAGYGVACGLAGEHVFCPDRTGAVHRTGRDGSGDRVVASSRSGSRIGAAALGSHAALAYLASRQTSEGWVSEAWLAVDDEAPVRLSEDGSGATSIVLAPRGSAVVAASVDARTALTALHVRPVTFEAHAKLGEDVVVFVGGPGDRRMTPSMVLPGSGPAWALLPIAKDAVTFGMAQVRVDEPAKVDEPVSWSMYPNGLDPAPVAASVHGATAWVARVRPKGAEVGSARLLELGTLSPEGVFTAKDVLADAGGKTSDLTLLADAHGGVWVAWVDGAGSWLERVACK